jgi:hypothetical protein
MVAYFSSVNLKVVKKFLLWLIYLEKIGEKIRDKTSQTRVFRGSPLTPLIKGGTDAWL